MEGVWKIGCLTKSGAREFFLPTRVDNKIHSIDEKFLLSKEVAKHVIKVIKKPPLHINKNIEERSKISTSRTINSNP